MQKSHAIHDDQWEALPEPMVLKHPSAFCVSPFLSWNDPKKSTFSLTTNLFFFHQYDQCNQGKPDQSNKYCGSGNEYLESSFSPPRSSKNIRFATTFFLCGRKRREKKKRKKKKYPYSTSDSMLQAPVAEQTLVESNQMGGTGLRKINIKIQS